MLDLVEYTGAEKWLHQYISDAFGVDSWGALDHSVIDFVIDHDLKTVTINAQIQIETLESDGYGHSSANDKKYILTRSPDSFNNLYKNNFNDSSGQNIGSFVSHQNFNRFRYDEIPAPDYESFFDQLKIWGTNNNVYEEYYDGFWQGRRHREYYSDLYYLTFLEVPLQGDRPTIPNDGWMFHFQSPLYKKTYSDTGHSYYLGSLQIESGGNSWHPGYFWTHAVELRVNQYGNHASETGTDPPTTTYQTYLMETDDNGILLDDIPQTAGANGLRFLNGKNYVI